MLTFIKKSKKDTTNKEKNQRILSDHDPSQEPKEDMEVRKGTI